MMWGQGNTYLLLVEKEIGMAVFQELEIVLTRHDTALPFLMSLYPNGFIS